MERKRILVVDDEEDIRNLLKSRLELSGFECLTAQDGEEAVKIAREEKPSLIVLDLVLPRRDGLQVFKELRSHKDTRDIPVVVYTAQNPEVVADKGIEALEVVDFVLKPFDSKDLVFLIKQSLKKTEGG